MQGQTLFQGEDRLKPYLIEVNARPQLKDDIVDKAVNRPMVRKWVDDGVFSAQFPPPLFGSISFPNI